MKREAWATILAVAMFSGACSARPDPTLLADCPTPPTMMLDVEAASIAYDNKALDPVPGFQRDCPFWIKSTWDASTNNAQFVKLSGFKSVTYKPATSSQPDGWDGLVDRTLVRHPSGATVTEVVLTKNSTDGGGTMFRFPSANAVTRARLMLFSLRFKSANGTEINIDPPWSEKRRR